MGLKLVLGNSFLYSVANVLQGAVSFILLPVYTRYLEPKEYAILALVVSFSGILSSIITFQIQAGIPIYVIKFIKDKERAVEYFSSIFIFLFLIVAIICGIVTIFGEKIIKIMFSDKDQIVYYPYFLIATWALLPNLLVSSGLSLVQTLEKGKSFFLISLVQTVINVILALFFVIYLKTGIFGILMAQLLSYVFSFIMLIWFIRDWLKLVMPKFSKDVVDSLKYSLPIIPHMLSIYIYMYSDRLILQRYVPLSDIGIYSIAGTFAYVLLVIVNSTTAAYSPRFLKLAEENADKARSETNRFIEFWWMMVLVILAGYFFLSGFVVRFMTTAKYYLCIPLIPILASAYIFRGLYCFAAGSLFHKERTQFIPVISFSAAIVNVIINIIFIPKFGIFAAAWSTVVSYGVTFALSYYFSRKIFPIFFPWAKMQKSAYLLLALIVLTKLFTGIFRVNLATDLSVNMLMFVLFSLIVFFVLNKEYSRKAMEIVFGYLRF